MIKQLFIANDIRAKSVFTDVEKPAQTDFVILSSIEEIDNEIQNQGWFSVLVIDSPKLNELEKLKSFFPSATIVATYSIEKEYDAMPDYVDELIYSRADTSFKRILAKKLVKHVELRRLRRRNKLNEAFFERIEVPIIVTKRVGNGPFKVVSFNKPFIKNSIVKRHAKLKNEIDLLTLYKVSKHESNAIGDVQFQRKVSRNKSEFEVDVNIISNKLKYSNTEYQIAIEIEHRVNKKEVRSLEERIDYIESSQKSQSEFLASVAHDLRKPLNNIIGLVDLISDSEQTDEQNFINKSLSDSSEMLKNLLTDVLDNSSLDAGSFEIVNDLFEIRPFVQSIETMFLNEVREKNISFQLKVSDQVPVWLKGDKNRLSQIIINLISNAVKFTNEGHVHLNVDFKERNKDEVVLTFEVDDSGVGIDSEHIDSIFESYNQGSADTKSKYGGTGLGLTITKKITTLMQGDISVYSKKNEGSRFTVEIPFEISTVNEERSDENENTLKGLRFLVIDDNEIASFVLAKLIEKNGGTAIEAYSGNEALKSFEQNDINFVITDIQLPDINGIRLSNKLKTLAKAKNKNLPVIGLSAFPYPNRLKNEGFVDYFALKPISQDTLLTKIKETFENSQNQNSTMDYRIIDIEHINNFTGGDPDFIKQLVDIFLKRTPEYMNELKLAVDNKDWTQIKTMAHKVKPTFTYVGMGSFTKKVGSIEDYAIKKDIDTIYKIMDEVWDDCQLAFDEFEYFVKTFDE
ncbi:MAG: response regulator [Bacteroidia bacterium]